MNIIILLCLNAYVGVTDAQQILKLEDAITIAVENNYAVQLGKNSVELAKRNTDLSEVGKKPTFGLTSGVNGNLNNSHFKYFGRDDAFTNTAVPSLDVNIGAAANILLWDGNRIKNQVKQKKEEEGLSKLSLKSIREELSLSVSNAYYNVARMSENISLLEASILISEKRKVRTQYAFNYGTLDKLALLNASVDLNRDSIELIKFEQQLLNAKRSLNLLLNRSQDIVFEVETTPVVNRSMTFEQYYDLAFDRNILIQMAKQNLNISSYNNAINKAALKPSVNGVASYGANYQNKANSDVALFALDYSLTDAARIGLTASWPLFDGGRTKYLNQIAALRINAETIQLNQINDQVKLGLTNTWGEYQNALLVLDLEKENVDIAYENFLRTHERFKIGQINSITFRQAQLNLLLAQINQSTAKYNAKLIELDLNKLSGQVF